MIHARRAAVAAGAALVAMLSPIPNARAATNLLENPGFEQVKDGKAVGWRVNTGSPCRATVVSGGGQVRSGKHAVKLESIKADPRASGHYYSNHVPVGDNTLYTVSLWTRGRGTMTLMLYLYDRTYAGGASAGNVELSEEWTRHVLYWSKGPEDAKIARAVLAVAISGKGASIFVDDTSVTASPFPKPANLIPNGNFETDADRNGSADGWTGGTLEKGPDGSRAHRCKIEAPESGFDKSAKPDQWWNWPAGQFPTPSWSGPITSAPFPVQGPMRYRVRLQIQAKRIRGEHVCVWWLDKAGRVLTRSTLGGQHSGTWGWQELVADVSSPPGATQAKLGIITKAGGGMIWVDNAVMVPALGSPASWRTKTQRTAVPGAKPLRDKPQPSGEVRPTVRVGSRGPTRNAVRVGPDGVKILLSSGMTLFLARKGKTILGIKEVRYRNLPLRNPDAPPIAPLFETTPAGTFRSCRFVDAKADPERVVVRIRLKGKATVDVDWVFEPHQREIGGEPYVGFAYGYRFQVQGGQLLRLCDRATWELGGLSLGNTVIDQQTYEVDHVYPIDRTSTYCTRNAMRFVFGEGFDYQYGPEGSLVGLFEYPADMTSGRAATKRFIAYQDTYRFPTVTEGRTPLKYVLFSPGRGGLDEWARVRDHIFGRYRDHYGIVEHDPLPLARGGLTKTARGQKNPARWWADHDVPEVAKLGFKYLRVLGVSTMTYDLSDTDTPENLTYLQQKSEQNGVGLVAWLPTVHLSQHSPYWAQHPEWEIAGKDGKPATGYCWPAIRGFRLKEAMPFMLRQLAALRKKPGLVGLWMDSYCNFTHGILPDDYNFHLRQAEQLFKYHAEIQKLGYVTYCEASPCFGIKSPGFPVENEDGPEPRLPRPETLYKTSQYVGDSVVAMRHLAKGNTYYRHLANKSAPWMVLHLIADDKPALERIAQANRDYVKVLPDMKVRTLLDDGQGVRWHNPANGRQVLFCYKDAAVPVGWTPWVLDVTTGKGVSLPKGGTLQGKASHTYRIGK